MQWYSFTFPILIMWASEYNTSSGTIWFRYFFPWSDIVFFCPHAQIDTESTSGMLGEHISQSQVKILTFFFPQRNSSRHLIHFQSPSQCYKTALIAGSEIIASIIYCWIWCQLVRGNTLESEQFHDLKSCYLKFFRRRLCCIIYNNKSNLFAKIHWHWQ